MKVTGRLSVGDRHHDITQGVLRGDLLTFTAGGTKYEARVSGETMSGVAGTWAARRVAQQ